MRRCVTNLVLAGAFAVGVASTAAAGPIVYSQPAVFPPGPGGSAYTSEIATDFGGPVFRVWDNFTLASSAGIGGVQWQGVYVNDLGPAPFADATSFDIDFYADSLGVPGVLASSTSFLLADVNQTLVGSQTWFGQASPVFNYSVSLPTAFGANGGTQYWLSIVAHSPTFRPIWAWTAGTGGNNTSVQDYYFDASPPYLVGQDRTFTLTQVPEPGTLTLLGSALVALFARRFRRARA